MSDFVARFAGHCPAGDQILEGQAVMYVDDEVWHVDCVGSERVDERPGKFEGTTLEEMGY